MYKNFNTKNFGLLKYFLEVEVVRSKEGLCISQRKYTLNLLSERDLLGVKLVDRPMDANNRLMPRSGGATE